jgi:hypothetical protein
LDTCHGVKLHTTKKMRDGAREWSVPSFAYYAGRKNGQLQTTTNHYTATPMTLALAEQLTARLNSAGMETTVCDLYADPETVIRTSLVEINEEAPPPTPPPSTLQDLGTAIENCFRRDSLSPLEVLTHCCRVVLNG